MVCVLLRTERCNVLRWQQLPFTVQQMLEEPAAVWTMGDKWEHYSIRGVLQRDAGGKTLLEGGGGTLVPLGQLMIHSFIPGLDFVMNSSQ